MLSHSPFPHRAHTLFDKCALMLIWNSPHIYPSPKASGNRTQCHCHSRKTVKQIYAHVYWWGGGGGLHYSHTNCIRDISFLPLLNKRFINVKSVSSLAVAQGPNSPEYGAAGPEGQRGDWAENIYRQRLECAEAQPASSSVFSNDNDGGN